MDILFLCLKVFFARILDVSMGTARTIIMVKGKSVTASLIGFFEIFIWFLVVREALNTDQGGIFIAFSYSLGFAIGTLIGSMVSNKFIEGNLAIQVITVRADLDELIRENGYAVTVLDVKGQSDDEKYMLVIEIRNKNLANLKKLIHKLDDKAFMMVTETKLVHNGYIK